jgi:RES domain-containing protein
MSRHVWRLTKAAHAAAPLDGEGARLYGSRWTSPGHAVSYCSTEVSCTALEVLVHIGRLSLAPTDYRLIDVVIPDALWSAADVIRVKDLPKGWQRAGSTACVDAGDAWLARAEHAALLIVPSAVVRGVRNVLIDSTHADVAHLRVESVEPFTFDARLFGAQN